MSEETRNVKIGNSNLHDVRSCITQIAQQIKKEKGISLGLATRMAYAEVGKMLEPVMSQEELMHEVGVKMYAQRDYTKPRRKKTGRKPRPKPEQPQTPPVPAQPQTLFEKAGLEDKRTDYRPDRVMERRRRKAVEKVKVPSDATVVPPIWNVVPPPYNTASPSERAAGEIISRTISTFRQNYSADNSKVWLDGFVAGANLIMEILFAK